MTVVVQFVGAVTGVGTTELDSAEVVRGEDVFGLVTVQGQSVIVSVSDSVAVYVFAPMVISVAIGQYVVYAVTTSVV